MNTKKYIQLDLETYRNNSVEFSLELLDLVTGGPVNLTTADIWFTAKQSLDSEDSAAIVQVTKTGGGIVVGGVSSNKLTVRADHVASAQPNEAMSLECDVKVQLPDQYAQVVAKGKLKVVKAVTLSP